MKRENKIKKLKMLGVYDRWYNNTINDVRPCDPEELLDEETTWDSFISRSFFWSDSPEKNNYWLKISRK